MAKNFTDNGDGTVIDNKTALVWQQREDGKTKIWEDAISSCELLSLGGKNDWRLPNRKELRSLVDYSQQLPSVDSTYFPNLSSSLYAYWSSTTYYGYTEYAWYVLFAYGSDNYQPKANDYNVRCVRGG